MAGKIKISDFSKMKLPFDEEPEKSIEKEKMTEILIIKLQI